MFNYVTLNNGYQIGHECPATGLWIPHPDYGIIEYEIEAYRIASEINCMEFGTSELDYNDIHQLKFEF